MAAILEVNEIILKHKLITIGMDGVGKTSLLQSYVRQEFYDNVTSTVGATFFPHEIYVGEKTLIRFGIWDTAGQERYDSLLPMYYRNSNAAIIVYDIQNLNSFNRAKKYVNDLQERMKADSKKIVIALVGNKSDMTNNRMIKFEKAEKYAKENDLIFFETSAKYEKNVKELFLSIARKLYENEMPHQDTTNSVNLNCKRNNTLYLKCCQTS